MFASACQLDRVAAVDLELRQIDRITGRAARVQPRPAPSGEQAAAADQAIGLPVAGRYADAIPAARQAAAAARQHQLPRLEGAVTGVMGQGRLHLGDVGGATQMARGIQLMTRHPHPTVLLARAGLAQVWWWYGDLVAADAAALIGREAAERAESATVGWFTAVQAALAYAAAAWQTAVALAEDAFARWGSQEMGFRGSLVFRHACQGALRARRFGRRVGRFGGGA
jgi:hypothetical protein